MILDMTSVLDSMDKKKKPRSLIPWIASEQSIKGPFLSSILVEAQALLYPNRNYISTFISHQTLRITLLQAQLVKMHISNILVAFMTGAAVVMAAPAPGVNDGLQPRGDCPNGWVKCGVSLLSIREVSSG